jgi:exopolysaccharide production protein ExoQ
MTANPRLSEWDARWITVVLVAAVLFSILPPGFPAHADEASLVTAEGSLEMKLQWAGIFSVSAYVVYRHLPLLFANLRAVNPFLLLMLAYTFLSAAWSPADSVTIKKAIQFGGLILFTLAVQTTGKPWYHAVLVIQCALLGIEVVSAVVSLVYPAMGIDAYFGYAWRGVLSGKNTLGGTAALSLIMWAGLWRVPSVSRRLCAWGIGFSVLCVVMSRSSTAITTASLGVMMFWLLRRQHIGSTLWLLRALVGIGLIFLVIMQLFFIAEGRFPDRAEILEPFANLFGKNADLTGRADIWEPLFIEIEKHWVFGVGYGGFWLGPGSASQPIIDRLPWIPYQAHNGYLDIFNELGAVGMILFIGVLISHFRDLFKMMSFDRTGAALCGAMQMTLLITNYTESSIFRGVVFQFWLFLLLCVTVSTALRRERQLRRSALVELPRNSGRSLHSKLPSAGVSSV